MVQPIELRLKDSKAQDYFAQMKEERNNNRKLYAQQEEQLVHEIEREIAQALAKIDSNAKLNTKKEEEKKKIGMSGLNENLNKVANMNSVIFQFELLENKNLETEAIKKELILKVIDKETNEVLSQYPTELSVKIAKMLDQLIGRGQLANATV